MKDRKDKIIIGLSVALGVVIIVSAGIIAYLLISNSQHRGYANTDFARGNFSLNNETLSQTENLFSTASSQSDISSYCAQSGNMIYCRDYCMRINPSNSFCNGIPATQYPGAPQ
jgi:hypothetical protein